MSARTGRCCQSLGALITTRTPRGGPCPYGRQRQAPGPHPLRALPDPDMGGIMHEKSPLPGGHSYRTTLEERVGERARSRLFEMCKVIRMPAVNDYRIRPHHA